MAEINKINPRLNQPEITAETALPAKSQKAAPLSKDKFEKAEKPGVSLKQKVQDFWATNVKGSKKQKSIFAGMDFTTKAAIAGGTLGTTIGGLVGYQAGQREVEKAQSANLSWPEPVMEKKHLGNIPSDYYTPKWGIFIGGDHVIYNQQGGVQGGDPVYRESPVYNPDGSVQMKEVTSSLNSQRYGALMGSLGGMLLGGIGGVLGGITLGLLARLAKREWI